VDIDGTGDHDFVDRRAGFVVPDVLGRRHDFAEPVEGFRGVAQQFGVVCIALMDGRFDLNDAILDRQNQVVRREGRGRTARTGQPRERQR